MRRKREDRTDYKKRLALLKSKTLRLVVRKTNKHVSTQLILYGEDGDKVVESAHTRDLEKFGWKIRIGKVGLQSQKQKNF